MGLGCWVAEQPAAGRRDSGPDGTLQGTHAARGQESGHPGQGWALGTCKKTALVGGGTRGFCLPAQLLH